MNIGSTKKAEIHEANQLAGEIRKSKNSEYVVATTLKTDDRVIARVTDGIYRQPGSALRELISNAYDADATRVVVNTDAPRFGRIEVEDNGHGMDPDVLAHLLLHIGGSAKRTEGGRTLGITSSINPSLSPKGRRLIGKIGIGLFSVSQLTHSFQIITKVEGDDFRTIATIVLKQYQDEDFSDEEGGKQKFESGKVNIWREKAADKSSHGTSVILTNIRPQARNTLRSREIWDAIEQERRTIEIEENRVIEPPKFHIGRVDNTGEHLEKEGKKFVSLPWDLPATSDAAFRQMVNTVWNEIGLSSPNPKLDQIFDYYLRMIWQLSLSIPLPYVDGHLFDMELSGWAEAFELSNSPKGGARKLDLKNGRTIREELKLTDPVQSVGQFDVYFDGLKLFRPIKFNNLPTTNSVLKKPLIFFGKCHEEFSKVPQELSGGALKFEAYLFWSPKIAPTEHQGALVRIHGSSGTLFDSSFMRYQVAEQTRLRQITCEIFVSEGLDSALNIDRESFNNAHPHSVYITKWLHAALRQLATTQKKLANEAREQTRDESKEAVLSEIQRIAIDVWTQEVDDTASTPPAIEIFDTESKTRSVDDSYVFARSAITSKRSGLNTYKQRAHEAVLEEKLKAIAQVLASFGLLDAITKRKQEKLLKAIYTILEKSEE